MKNCLTYCLVALNIIATPAVFAGDKYEIRISPVLVRSEWRGPSTESLGLYEQGFEAPGKAGKPTLIPIKMDTPGDQKRSLETLRIVMKSRNDELKTARSNIAAHVDAYARSHTDHRENRYIHNHTTGTVNHVHSGTVNSNVNVQQPQGESCGSYDNCSCGVSRPVQRYGSHYRYYCPQSQRWNYSYNRSWNWSSFNRS